MNARKFVAAIRAQVRDATIEDTISNIERPPGRAVPNSEQRLSNWYHSLSEDKRELVRQIIAKSVDEAMFGLLCVIDGVRTIEPCGGSGQLVLTHVDQDVAVRINDPAAEYLHDIFNEG